MPFFLYLFGPQPTQLMKTYNNARVCTRLKLLLVTLLISYAAFAQTSAAEYGTVICSSPNTNVVLKVPTDFMIIIDRFIWKSINPSTGSTTQVGTGNTYTSTGALSQRYVLESQIWFFTWITYRTDYYTVIRQTRNLSDQYSVNFTSNCKVRLSVTPTPSTATRYEVYEWGWGSAVGSNKFATTNTPYVDVTPEQAGNYSQFWVRLSGAFKCNINSKVYSLSPLFAKGLTATPSTLCGSQPLQLQTTPHGNLLSDLHYQWGYVNGSTHVVLGTGTSPTYTVNNPTTRRYFVRSIRNNCGGPYQYVEVTVASPSTQPTAVSASYLPCNSQYKLTATGGALKTGARYHWYSKNGGNFVLVSTTTTNTVTLNAPAVPTDYYVFIADPAPCTGTVTEAAPTIRLEPNSATGNAIGTITGDSTTCSGKIASNLQFELAAQGFTYSIVRWQKSTQANFSTLTNIANTTATLTPTQLGTINQITYVRVQLNVAGCANVYSPVLVVRPPTTKTYNTANEWVNNPPQANDHVKIRTHLHVNQSAEMCSCTIENNSTVQLAPAVSFTMEGNLQIDNGSLLQLADKASVVQRGLNATASGQIQQQVVTAPMKNYDYTYWSSPVSGMTLQAISPQTLADKYHSFDPISGNWITHLNGNHTMEVGKGYIIRAPQGWSLTNASAGQYSATFSGKPNAGTITVPVKSSADNRLNLVGNPYPSSLSLDDFLLDPANSALEGKVYIWTHATALAEIAGLPGLNYTQDDYVIYNLTGATDVAHPNMQIVPHFNAKIAAGQSFMVELEQPNTNAQIVFNNPMRRSSEHTYFYRQAEYSPDQTRAKNRLWIHLTDSNLAYKQALVGYVDGATNAYDRLFDARLSDQSSDFNLYSLLDAQPYTIQGRSLPFAQSDVVPLGYQVNAAGTYTIGLSQFDGLFTEQAVYLFDRQLNTVTDLKTTAYSFSTAAGQFDHRFEIRYEYSTLADKEWRTAAIAVVADQKQVQIQAPTAIETVYIYDMAGRLIHQGNAQSAMHYQIALTDSANAIVLVRIQLQNGTIHRQKIHL